MTKKILIPSIAILVLLVGYWYVAPSKPFDFSGGTEGRIAGPINQALAARFDYLSQNGNSSCSQSFRDSIASMADAMHLQGSCCSPMSTHRYREQVEGLKKFKSEPSQNIAKIPDDPYNIKAELAKELMSYYDMELTADEQNAYDYAMQHSSEKGPCCCKCWRWYVYGGLGKYLIRNHQFTGQQVTNVWDLSDGCGGDSEHHHG
ncbi:MAG: hypothetical protein Q8R35_03675 [bacterium]|nr:hypothetical protein [bacterium]